MKRILAFADGVTPTGFSTVSHNIFSNLKDEYEINHIAVNYFGDPHSLSWKVYPASLGGDAMGFGRIKFFAQQEWDGIFLLNDVWVIRDYLKGIKTFFKKIPPIVVYFPVDSEELDPEWFEDFDIVSQVVAYTEFGKKEILKAKPGLDVKVIPHGVDRKTFFRIDKPKEEIKKMVYPDTDEFINSFILFSASRNQPRKRLDLMLEAFKLFSEGKPNNVKLHMHCGRVDAGWDLVKLAFRLGIDSKLILTNQSKSIQTISASELNIYYNATDVGVNSSLGEGWGLTAHEHAATGAVQVVPNHSVHPELFKECGMMYNTSTSVYNPQTLTKSYIPDVFSMANAFEILYRDRELVGVLSKLCYEKFSSDYYDWKNIVNNMWSPVFRETFK